MSEIINGSMYVHNCAIMLGGRLAGIVKVHQTSETPEGLRHDERDDVKYLPQVISFDLRGDFLVAELQQGRAVYDVVKQQPVALLAWVLD